MVIKKKKNLLCVIGVISRVLLYLYRWAHFKLRRFLFVSSPLNYLLMADVSSRAHTHYTPVHRTPYTHPFDLENEELFSYEKVFNVTADHIYNLYTTSPTKSPPYHRIRTAFLFCKSIFFNCDLGQRPLDVNLNNNVNESYSDTDFTFRKNRETFIPMSYWTVWY